MITLTKEMLSRIPHHFLAYFGCKHCSYGKCLTDEDRTDAFWTFEPAVNLSMAIIQDPFSANANVLDRYVVDAMQLLELMSDVNKVALEGLDSIQSMRAKYLQITTTAKGASPIATTSTSGSSQGKISPVSLTYSSGTSPPSSISPLLPFVPVSTQLSSDNAPTPNALFDQFFSQYTGQSPTLSSNAAELDVEKLLNFDPTLYNNDPGAAWLTQPMDNGGLDAWPMGYSRLEGETDIGDWKKMLGL